MAGRGERCCWALMRLLAGAPRPASRASRAAQCPCAPRPGQVAARSMLVKAILEPWGEGGSLEEVVADVAQFPAESKAPYQGAPRPASLQERRLGRCRGGTL